MKQILKLILSFIFIDLFLCKKKNYQSYISELSLWEQDGKAALFTIKIKGGLIMVNITTTQQVKGTLNFKDRKGNPTDVADGAVSVSTENSDVAEATYDDEKNEITVTAKGPGVTGLVIKATSQNGQDLPFEPTAIQVRTGDAVAGTVSFAEPEEQPDATDTGSDTATDTGEEKIEG